MKFRTFLMTTSLLLGGLAWAGPNDAHHKPMHGGVVNTVKDIDYELVAKSSLIQLYLRDHGKAVDVDTIKEELLWQMKSIMMFRLDFLRAVCSLEQLAVFGDQVSKLASCSFRAISRELDPLELRSDSVQGFESLHLVIVPIL